MITIAASKIAYSAIQPLVQAYSRKGISHRWVCTSIVSNAQRKEWAEDSVAILQIGERRRSPRTMLAGPFVQKEGGRLIPVSYLPEVATPALKLFAETAAKIHQREKNSQSIAVLGQRQKRFIKLAGRVEKLLEDNAEKTPVFKWTSDLLLREDMLQGLRSGIGLALYFGHGRPIGWVGYYGTRKHHFETQTGEPLGALLNICCATASRKRTGLSFSEALPLQGAAAASFGAVTDTLHTDNMRWAVRITKALETGVNTIGELLVNACPPTKSSVQNYRLFGDPLAPIIDTPKAIERAKKVKVYP